VAQAHWHRLCLCHWHKQAGCTKPVPLGLGEVKINLSLCHGTSHIPPSGHSLCHGTSSIPRWSLYLFHLCQLVTKSGSTRPCINLCTKYVVRKWPICKTCPEGLGLPVRDCARSCNNREHTRTQLSAIDVTIKAFFERLYLVLGMGTFGPWVNCPYALTTPTVHSSTISRFPCNFFPQMAPQFFCHHDSPSNLVESRYPPCPSSRFISPCHLYP